MFTEPCLLLLAIMTESDMQNLFLLSLIQVPKYNYEYKNIFYISISQRIDLTLNRTP